MNNRFISTNTKSLKVLAKYEQNHEDELENMKMLLKAKDDEIGILASKIDLLSDVSYLGFFLQLYSLYA